MGWSISDEDLEAVRNSVVQLEDSAKAGMSRQEIIIAMFGGIRNPATGKRFAIPFCEPKEEDYEYKYAENMRTLVNKPEMFERIMNFD